MNGKVLKDKIVNEEAWLTNVEPIDGTVVATIECQEQQVWQARLTFESDWAALNVGYKIKMEELAEPGSSEWVCEYIDDEEVAF